jgi:hypothetical protein
MVKLAFFNLFYFLNENPCKTDKSKLNSWKEKIGFLRFRVRENM